tara:strand:- start:10065 stop:12494 length:2430 start_codon:yes stop_codon:yes gene_type:complete
MNSNGDKYKKGTTLSNEQIQGSQGNEDVVDFGDLIKVFQRRSKLFILIVLSTMGISTGVTFFQLRVNPIYKGSFSLLVSDPFQTTSRRSSSMGEASGNVFQELALSNTTNDLPTLIEFLKSPFLLQPVADKFNINVRYLQSSIKIKTLGTGESRAKGIIEVQLLIRNKKKGKEILKELTKTYLQTSLNQRQQRLSDGLSFLNDQAPELTEKTTILQTELEIFRRENYFLEPISDVDVIKKQEVEIESEILNLQSEKDRLELLSDEIINGNLITKGFREQSTSEGIFGNLNTSGKGLSFALLDQSSLDEYENLQKELAKARTKFVDDSYIIKNLLNKIKILEPKLKAKQLKAVSIAISINQNKTLSAKKQLEVLKEKFAVKPELIKKYETLQQKLKMSQANLESLVSAREKLQLQIAQNNVPWKVIDPPTFLPRPIKPSLPRNIVFSFFYGLFFGGVLILIRDKLDNIFHNSKEIEDTLRIPLLADIPFVDNFKSVRQKQSSIVDLLNEKTNKDNQTERFFYQEAMRSLYTSLRFLNSEEKIKSIVFTSSIPGEGKSLVSILLAQTISKLDKKVLIIDGDMRKPQLHVRLKMNNVVGLSNLLSDKSLDWKDVKIGVPENKNWDVITAGIIPPDPTRLLTSSRLRSLIEDIHNSNQYDLVLIDACPVIGLSDALLISEIADGLVMITTINNVNKYICSDAINRIKNFTSVNFLGIVTNSVKINNSFSLDKYQYGYKYGYGAYSKAYQSMAYYDSYFKSKVSEDIKSTNSEDLKNDNSESLILRKFLNKEILLKTKTKLKNYFFEFIKWIDK